MLIMMTITTPEDHPDAVQEAVVVAVRMVAEEVVLILALEVLMILLRHIPENRSQDTNNNHRDGDLDFGPVLAPGPRLATQLEVAETGTATTATIEMRATTGVAQGLDRQHQGPVTTKAQDLVLQVADDVH